MAVIPSPTLFRLNGQQALDGQSIDRLMTDFTRSNRPHFALQEAMTGNQAIIYRLSTYGRRRGPVGVVFHKWDQSTRFCDDTLFPLIQRLIERPVAQTEFVDGIKSVLYFDGDGSTTEFYTHVREILSDTYTASGGLGSNAGTAVNDLTITRLDTAATYTLIYARTMFVDDWNLFIGADTITVSVTDENGLTTTTTGTNGAEWTAAVSDIATATSISGWITGLSGVTAASGGTDTVTLTKDSTTVDLTVTTTAAAGAMVIHPNGTEVAIDTSGTQAWKNFKFGTAPPNTAAVIELQGTYIYTVAPMISAFVLPARRDGIHALYEMSLVEIGDSVVA